MAMKKLKKFFEANDTDVEDEVSDEFYKIAKDESTDSIKKGSGKMILLEPRAYSEAQQIADYLKSRNTVVVNMKRVTSDQAKRIVDFLSGTVYAIGGELQKIGGGIFLCTPNNINVEGKITEDNGKEEVHDNTDLDTDW